MPKVWQCPAHDGPITDYTLLDKKTGKGRWKVQIRCLTPTVRVVNGPEAPCNAVLNVMKGGVYLAAGAPSRAA